MDIEGWVSSKHPLSCFVPRNDINAVFKWFCIKN